MKNQQNTDEYMVGFFTGYNQSPYSELPDILEQLNSRSDIRAYKFSEIADIHPSTTHVVLRHSTEYYRNLSSFYKLLSHLDNCGIKTINSSELIRWNTNKRYLGDLALHNIRIPKTIYFTKSQLNGHETIQHIESLTNDFKKIVLKPVVSASGWNTFLLENPVFTEIKEKIEGMNSEEWMIQEFIPEIKIQGEWSVIFLGGQFFQAVKKTPAENEFKSQPEYGGIISAVNHLPPRLEETIRKEILEQLHPLPFYLRVDLIPTKAIPVLIEIECIEPDLLLNDHDKILRYTELLISHIKSTG